MDPRKTTVQNAFGNEEDEQLILREMTGKFSTLPLEITFNILSRVPIKTLSQSCRWVSKSWFKILSNPRFAQIQHAKASQIFSPCVTYYLPLESFYLVDHQVIDNHETSATAYHSDINFGRAIEVVGSCNGLICMGRHPNCKTPPPYFIFNPITRDYINLPKSPMHQAAPRITAFGFDPITNDHKVLRLMKTGEVEIYTLGSGPKGWRRLSNNPYAIFKDTTFLNGALHWTILKLPEKQYGVLAFDMSTEKFREIPPPPPCVSLNQTPCTAKSVGVIGGCLCFTNDDFDDRSEIWVMKSYGVHNSWSKEYIIRKKLLPFRDWNDRGYQGIKLENGELLLKYVRKGAGRQKDLLHYYNPKTEVFTPIVPNGIPSSVPSNRKVRCLKPIVHVGNLIAPKDISISAERCAYEGHDEATVLVEEVTEVQKLQMHLLEMLDSMPM